MFTTNDQRELRTELERRGVFEHRTGASWVKLIAMMAVVAGGTLAAILLPWWCTILIVPLIAIPAVTAAMIAHEAAHGSFSGSKTHNEIVLHLVFPLFGGLGAQHWKNKHNHRHHGNPNVEGHDDDIELWPMAMTSEAHAQSSGLRRWIQRNLQGYLFWPLTLFLGFTMRYESVAFAVRQVRAGRLSAALVVDMVCLLAHYTLWLVVPALFVGFLPALLFYAGLWATAGLLLALIFAPAHMGLPVVGNARKGWLHQLETTRNLRMPRWLSWFFVGLDYQVEHHLFPRIPHQNLAEAAEVTRAWCAQVGAPHLEISYAAGVADVTRFMFVSWRTAAIDRTSL